MRYYSTQRPLVPGAFPASYEPIQVTNYSIRQHVEDIGREAYGYIEYSDKLPDEVAKAYELIPAGMKIWYGVITTAYDNGTIIAHIADKKEADSKPEAISKFTARKDIYMDWFSSYEEAVKFVREAEKA